MSKDTKLTDDETLSKSVAALNAVLPFDQTPSVDGAKVGLDEAALTNPKAKTADPATFIDASIEQEVSKKA